MTSKELAAIVEAHGKWLRLEEGGKRPEPPEENDA